ncbi:MAG: hypothetical protein DSM107014_14135 [Gomphosphaeria aponina SAG 52.96 = DSM 107014]|uniref:Uncharacterized protein n=1 Tax=Gomphosphaeria aponina SAG 52.96 = DSM 107014 TaxID=1521640 RepID=A0A941JVH9_9CHRO|nr:hypothetical protein [Gomphosphaeria aponina SAG 52.96 = DSM 107014]
MERGLLWLPLLVTFFWLAWSGKNEYEKVEAYRIWAEQFEQAKYDIYAVLGITGEVITWGKPTRSGPVNLQSFSLKNVQTIRLLVANQPVNLEEPPSKGSTVLEFILRDDAPSIKIPFTEISLAAKWGKYLQEKLR